ncbi:MAG: hypothetical protein K0R51_3440 [Cytophagaceae bacterium]|jgi:hypothetical protein|nr:hypothetical protein [Cytophagaceae bacterium]
MKIMKTFFVLLLTSIMAYGQTYKPTLSELSGNGPTVDNKGYVYNFRGGKLENCYNSVTTYNTVYNQLGSTNYAYELNAELGILNILANGKQTSTEVFCNHFTAYNCFDVEKSRTGFIDLSDEANRNMEIRVKSSVPVEKFGAYIMTMDRSYMIQLGNGEEHASESLPAGKWKVIKTQALFETWDGIALDASKVIGIGFYARNAEDPQPKGTIEIDYVKVGSSARSFIPSSEPSPTLQGYTFSFDGDSLHTCSAPVNTLGNNNFTFAVDESKHAAVLKQTVSGNQLNVFALEFTDRDCFLQPISFPSADKQFIEVRIKPDVDVPSFGVVLSADRLSDQLWDYAEVQKLVELKANEWNVVKLPVHFKGHSGEGMDLTKIRGVVLAFKPTRSSDKSKAQTVSYEIDYIKVGDVLNVSSKK